MKADACLQAWCKFQCIHLIDAYYDAHDIKWESDMKIYAGIKAEFKVHGINSDDVHVDVCDVNSDADIKADACIHECIMYLR